MNNLWVKAMTALHRITAAALVCIVASSTAIAQDQDLISFQGRLLVDDEPVTSPGMHLVFRIYEQAEEGSPIWLEEHLGVPVQDGLFSVLLGSSQSLGALPFEVPLWISVAVAEGGEMLPRTRFTSVPFSVVARRLQLPYHAAAAPEGDNAVISIEKLEEGPGWGDGLDIVVGDAVGHAWDVNNLTSDGVDVGFSLGHGLRVGYSGLNALYSELSLESAIEIDRAGWPSSTDTSSSPNGVEIHGAEGHGVFVGRADSVGLFIGSTGDKGVRIGEAADEGIHIGKTAANGVYLDVVGSDGEGYPIHDYDPAAFGVTRSSGTGLYVGRSDGDGVVLFDTGGDGVKMGMVGESAVDANWLGRDGIVLGTVGDPLTPTPAVESSLYNGIEIGVVRGHGIFIGRTEAGGIHIRETANNGVYVDSTGITGMHVRKAENNGFEITEAGQHGLYVGDAGGDGVHVAHASGWTGYFDGNVKSEGYIWADGHLLNSDRRLKRRIQPISFGLATALKLRPVEFEWARRPEAGTRLGLIAQEVDEVVPEAVVRPSSINPYYSIDYEQVVPILIRAIQELHVQVASQRAELDRLTSEIAGLRSIAVETR